MVDEIKISSFKQIKSANLSLSSVNVLVGGNNSGKSCILQGIHFGIALAQTKRIAEVEQFPAERLRYCPTDDFLDLHHGRRLTERSSIKFEYIKEDDSGKNEAQITLQRGRNGVVKAKSVGGTILNDISDPRGFFSIYVPGLAGITIREEYRSDAIVSNGIARGDANLYLRNVLLRIEQDKKKKDKFSLYLNSVFPGVQVSTAFNETNDLWIRSVVQRDDKEPRALDMVGTGLLQAIQILAYVSNYNPKMLLLDEPDAHLHPSNQRLLSQTLDVISKETDTKIILATHSRHLLDSLSESNAAKLFWVKSGIATEQDNWSDIAILMDLGALDKGEKFLNGDYKYLVLTEDSNTKPLEVLLEANHIPAAETLIFSYKTSSKFDAAKLMASFAERVRPGVITVVHRDRDFMSDDEVSRLLSKYEISKSKNMKIFITESSDVESYFIVPDHLSIVSGKNRNEIIDILESILKNNMVKFLLSFREKREEIKRNLYKKDPENCPEIESLVLADRLQLQNALGKKLLAEVCNYFQSNGINGGKIVVPTKALIRDDISKIFS